MMITQKLRNQLKNLSRWFYGSLVIKVTSLIVALVVFVAVISNLLLQNLSYQALKENVRSGLVMTASQGAAMVDAELLKTLKGPLDEGNANYLVIQNNLQKFQSASMGHIRYIYILIKNQESILYAVDAVPLADRENHSKFGDAFVVEDYTVVMQGFEKPTADVTPTKDLVYGGMSQTGYAPIRDSKGRVVGVLAIDVDASIVEQKKALMDRASLITWCMSLLLALAGGLLLAKYLIRPIIKLKLDMKTVSDGNYDELLVSHRTDELGELTETFNFMVNELKASSSELKLISAEMIHQEKLAGIGQLSAGVAHEINNPLGFIKSNTEMLEVYFEKFEALYLMCRTLVNEYDSLSQDELKTRLRAIDDFLIAKKMEALSEDIKEISLETKDGLGKIEKIVKSLLSFVRKFDSPNFAAYNLNRGILDTLVVANNEVKYHAEVVTKLGEIPTVMAMASEINQVLLNMIINASYAVKETGEFGKITIRTYQEGGNVVCEVSDTGIGMSEETVKRIFEPFYTTKPIGVGTGLGLSMAYDIIVKKHHGTLKVLSQIGEGTTFIISLPQVYDESG